MSSQVPGKDKVQGFIYRLLNGWMPESWLRWLSNCFAPEPIYPLCVDLTAIEKAKMDYEHGLKVKEMRWDKGIFAVIIALVGAYGYYRANTWLDDHKAAIAQAAEHDKAEITRALEESRTKEAERRLLLEKQLPELLSINSAISDVTRVYFNHVGQAKAANEESVKKDYQEAAAKAREVINRSPFLFDVEFNTDLDRYFEVHRRMSRLPIAKWEKYRQFAACLSNEFDDLCRSVLEGARSQSPRMRMTLADIPFKKGRDMSDEQYVETHFKEWERVQKQRGEEAACKEKN